MRVGVSLLVLAALVLVGGSVAVAVGMPLKALLGVPLLVLCLHSALAWGLGYTALRPAATHRRAPVATRESSAQTPG